MPHKLSTASSYVRMSWAPENLYNLYRLSVRDAQPQHIAAALSFKSTGKTLYQQKWSSKRLLRAYHGDWISERRLKRRFLPSSLPPLQGTSTGLQDSKGKGRRDASSESIPLGSLMWREVEARLDVLVFRACFAHSIYEARRLVLHGHVKLNGKVVRDPNILLNPGEIFQVDPKEMYLLRQSDQPFSTQQKKSENGGQGQDGQEADLQEGGSGSVPSEAMAEEQAGVSPSASDTVEASADSAVTAPTLDAPLPTSQDSDGSTSKAGSTSAKSASRPTKPDTPPKPTRKEIPGLPFSLPDFAAPFLFVPAYLEVSFPTCSAIYVRHPTARPGYSEIPTPYDADGEVMRLGWEYYKGVGRRRRDLKDHGDMSDLGKVTQPFDDKGKRIWGKDWEERTMELRRMRGVRTQWGKWSHRPQV